MGSSPFPTAGYCRRSTKILKGLLKGSPATLFNYTYQRRICMNKITLADTATHLLLRIMAFHFNLFPEFRKYMRSDDGWINFSLGIRTKTGSVEQSISFRDGTVKVYRSIPFDVDVEMIFMDNSVLKKMTELPPNEVLNLILKNKLTLKGNLAYAQLFNFYISLFMKGKQIKMMQRQSANADLKERSSSATPSNALQKGLPGKRRPLRADTVDPGVKYLKDDPYLSSYKLDDFPRLNKFLDIHFTTKPVICHERVALLTKWYRDNGFETDKNGNPWSAELRQALAFKHLMKNKRPIIRKNDLIAGTTTTKEIGVVLYPDTHGTMIWGELFTTPYRKLFPYDISEDTREILHHSVFPYWINRNMREWVRHKYKAPLCQSLDERFAVYFLWKTAALSHTILDYPKLLKFGAKGIIREIKKELKKVNDNDQLKKDKLSAMIICYEGLISYAKNLSQQALVDSGKTDDPKHKAELERLAEICSRVPENPCKSLDEAINAIWIHWVGVHMENTNAGFSLGRMDQWLQPYFAADMRKLQTKKQRQEYIKHAIELVGCFYMRCTDHLPLIPDIGNYLFGGSSSD
ncbi:MAG: formate acetyltransferase, partial [Candidatus Atribacteria bacterium]